MGELVLSAFLQALFQNLFALLPLEEWRLVHGVEEDLVNLNDRLSMVQAVLGHAEERQRTDEAVRLWLNDLRGVAYDANDVLDEFATEIARRFLIPYARVRNSLSFLNPKRGLFSLKMNHKIKDIVKRLDAIAKRRIDFGLTVWDEAGNQQRNSVLHESTSLDPLSAPLRESDRQRIIELLVPIDGEVENKISVISILGMGGLGKTTLAKLVCNDETVKNYFELTLWVYVSYYFNVNRLTRKIIESIDSHVCDCISLDNLQKHLKKKLSGKRYLLVLDDVWTEKTDEWETLRVPLLYGAKGSRILVTTRSEEVSNIMSTSPPYRLRGFSDHDCWSLFCKYAFAQGPNAFSGMDNIGRRIVNKCKGLPLAAIALGNRLRKVADRDKWAAILENEYWEFSGEDSDIFLAVSPSYQQLPTHLKACFAYCCVIREGYEFEKEFIVQLWMSQNLFQPKPGERIEDTGSDYFDTLVQRSFFQFSHFDYKSGQPRYTMHDIIHKYAQHVSMEECGAVELGKACNISAKFRHVSLIYDWFEQGKNSTQSSLSKQRENIFKTLYQCKGLYTLLLACGSTEYEVRVPRSLAKKFRSLRTLDLSNCGISMLPDSIGDLKHLRCLQLRNTNIRKLPESVGCLYNLQILGLRNCDILELPWNTRNLRKLRHLDLHLDENSVMAQGAMSRGHSLKSMPPEIGLLTDLQTLSRFVVGRRYRCGIRELKDLNNLHGELQISNLHLVSNAEEVEEANLSSKQYIHRLELQWSHNHTLKLDEHAVEVEERVLANLQPHTNLKEIRVVGYQGASFPSWIKDSSFSKLVTLWLSNCKNCETLPPLGQLPVLKDLYIKEMDAVKIANCSFCGHDRRNFPSLEKLRFESMHNLQVWCGHDNCLFPSLRELIFKNCPDLRQLTHNLPSLTKLEIEGSPNLVGLRRFPSLESLEVKASGEWLVDSWSTLASLSSLALSGLRTSTLPSGLQLGHASSIRCLEISHCGQLVSLPDDWLPTGLTYFQIKHCPQLRALPRGLQNLKELEDLEIQNCGQLEYLPDGLKNLTSLMRFEISDCPQLLCLPGDGLPTKLQFLSINNCPVLGQRCRVEVGEDWPKIEHMFSVWIDGQLVGSSVQPQLSGHDARPLYQGQSSGQ